jgi:leucyl/phenylalanyl-tRNA--protein transferase
MAVPFPPIEPPPARFDFPPADQMADEDLVGVGADLSPGTLLLAYRSGMFPMHLEDGRLGWWSPVARGVIPLDGLKISQSLKKSIHKYQITIDRDLVGVIEGCADPSRSNGWINSQIRAAYLELGRLGWVHSIETRNSGGELVGGLYGVGIGGLFAGESMFSRQRDASKVALVALVKFLVKVPDALLDVQWATEHLQTLGAITLRRHEYHALRTRALAAPSPWPR